VADDVTEVGDVVITRSGIPNGCEVLRAAPLLAPEDANLRHPDPSRSLSPTERGLAERPVRHQIPVLAVIRPDLTAVANCW
jgi:hypothetical protein